MRSTRYRWLTHYEQTSFVVIYATITNVNVYIPTKQEKKSFQTLLIYCVAKFERKRSCTHGKVPIVTSSLSNLTVNKQNARVITSNSDKQIGLWECATVMLVINKKSPRWKPNDWLDMRNNGDWRVLRSRRTKWGTYAHLNYNLNFLLLLRLLPYVT